MALESREFEGKTALVTGAGSGIGAQIARRLGALGCRVAIADVDGQAAESVAAAIDAAGEAVLAIACDVADPQAVERVVRLAEDRWGGLHLAVNNAGLPGCTQSLADHELAEWTRVIGVNLSGVFYGMKYQIPAMLRAGGGAIVNIASILGEVGTPGSAAYVAAKHGVVGLTRSAALDYARHGIRVNAIGPGYIDTPLLKQASDTMRAELAGLHPMGRLGRADEIAELALFLLSERASFITGSHHIADGGYLAR